MGPEIRATQMKVNMVETAVTVFNSLTENFVLREKSVSTLRLEGGGRWTVDSS